MQLRVAVIIATRGRPKELERLLGILEQQSMPPDRIIVSACEPSDVTSVYNNEKVQIVFGPLGTTRQRNLAWASIKHSIDIIIFFDDDFIPSRFWVERAYTFMATNPDVVCLTGRVILDGVLLTGLKWTDGVSIVEKADSSVTAYSAAGHIIKDNETPYGCNMAIRATRLDHVTFDERLVLYGWLEDRDFGIRAAAVGRTIWTDAVWGVHLGAHRGRQSGLPFGYSQIVNPWYLMKKGVLTPHQSGKSIARSILGNAVGCVLPNPRVDRWGRFKGNILGIKDIACGNWAPERVVDL
jgi:GT2 family glycosyltransferase